MLDGATVTKECKTVEKDEKNGKKEKRTAKQHNISLMQFFNFQQFGGSVNTSYILCLFFKVGFIQVVEFVGEMGFFVIAAILENLFTHLFSFIFLLLFLFLARSSDLTCIPASVPLYKCVRLCDAYMFYIYIFIYFHFPKSCVHKRETKWRKKKKKLLRTCFSVAVSIQDE